MTQIMRSLEISRTSEGVMLANELDECNQITFVMSGRYNVGYAINKKSYYRK